MTSRLKPIQLVWFIVISSLLVTTALIVLAVRSWHLQTGQHLPSNLRTPCVTIMGIFLLAGFFGEWQLARGVRSGAWPGTYLQNPRRLVAHPVMKALSGAILVFAILYFFASPINGLGSFILFMCLPMSLSRVARTLKLKEAEVIPSTISGSGLYPAKPLESNRWGN
jgi:hypothetical protein